VKAVTVKLKVFEEADAAALEAAYETWRAAAGEKHIVEMHLSTDSTNIILAVFYTSA
jgi:hypothetical protein